MIITISGANFSLSNIGTLSTWTVSKSIGAGAEHSIPSYVNKNSAFNYTITLKDGYTFGTYSVTMGGQKITPTVTETSITINIASVTGAIRIEVKTINSSTGEPEQPGTGGGSVSGTTWYIKSLKELNDSGNDFSKKTRLACNKEYAWAFQDKLNSKLVGKTINTIELYVCEAGNGKFVIGIYDPETFTITESRTINVDASHVGTTQTYTFNDLTIPSGKYFVWNCSYTGGEAISYYILKANLDPLAVETSGWYYAKTSKLEAFGNHELVFTANIGYTGSGSPNPDTPDTPNPELPENATWYIQSLKQLEDSGNNYKTTGVNLTPNSQYAWAFQEELNNDIAGKTINAARLYIDKQGTTKKFTLGVYDPDTHRVTDVREIAIDDAHVGTVQLYTFNDLTIPSGKYFVWNCSYASGESSGRYVLEDKLDKTKVKTSGWYQAKSTSMDKFSNYRLVFVADFGYVPR